MRSLATSLSLSLLLPLLAACLTPAGEPPFDLRDWTPRPATGKAEPWEKATDKDWIDPRLRSMDTGLFFDATFDVPSSAGKQKVYRGTAIKLTADGKAGVLFDRNQLRLVAGWTGGFLKHGERRFGLLNTPAPDGSLGFATRPGLGWANPSGSWENPHPATAPLPRDWGRYRGLYLHGAHVVLSYTVQGIDVLDCPGVESADGLTLFTRTLEVGPSEKTLTLLAGELPAAGQVLKTARLTAGVARKDGNWSLIGLLAPSDSVELGLKEAGRVEVVLKPAARTRRIKLVLAHADKGNQKSLLRKVEASPGPVDLRPLTNPGPARWTQPVVTRGEVAPDNAPLVIDTLTVPYENPYKALMFLTGIDFLPSGEIAVCTAHGDVYLVKGANATLEKLTWKRFATGLYQPLGLKVVDGKIVVLERGQLTRLHDRNGDGEADFYECLCSDWHTGKGEHSFDTCLETDPAGNFYFFKTGDTDTPTGGCLMRVSKDGRKSEVFATGFRHPIGLGASPDGIITGADQEGNWMPATRIDQYRQGGFYGDMRAHHRPTPPTSYDEPLCWLPREVDNSAGGQVWVPAGKWGPLGGMPLHLSYGRCKLFLLLRQEVDGIVQGGAVDLGLTFLSGVARGRFNPADGHLYLVGLNGWQTAARRDGCLQRVRYTGQPLAVPVDLQVCANGLRLTFSQKLDPRLAADRANYSIAQWNYHWRAEYGSPRFKVSDPKEVGQDAVPIQAVTVEDGGKSVFLKLAEVRPVMQMQVAYHLKTAAGKPLVGSVFHTIHRVGN